MVEGRGVMRGATPVPRGLMGAAPGHGAGPKSWLHAPTTTTGPTTASARRQACLAPCAHHTPHVPTLKQVVLTRKCRAKKG